MSNFKDSPKFSKKFTETAKSIQKRQKPNDVFITPEILAKLHIGSIEYTKDDIWFDPFKNSGNYYNNFPKECKKDWCEILEGKDFFKYDKSPTIICSNPPYSLMDKPKLKKGTKVIVFGQKIEQENYEATIISSKKIKNKKIYKVKFDWGEEEYYPANHIHTTHDGILKKSIELKPRIISYLIALHNLTTKRIEMFNKADYGLTSLKMCKIYKWFGMSAIVTFTKGRPNMEGFGYDRTVYRNKK